MLVTQQKKKSRSGTQWTEDDYRAAGYERMTLRISSEARGKLDELAADAGISRTAMVETMINSSHAAMERRGRRAKPRE